MRMWVTSFCEHDNRSISPRKKGFSSRSTILELLKVFSMIYDVAVFPVSFAA